MTPQTSPAHPSGTFAIGGELTVHRLGLGAMRLPGVRGDRAPAGAAAAMLRQAVRSGVGLIDTARSYGRCEELIAEALHPYPAGLVIATRGGLSRDGRRDGRPERLRAECEASLRALRLDTIDLWQLHRIDPAVPLDEQLGAVGALREEGKIRHVGLSEVTLDELRRARRLIDVATVQNRFNLAWRAADDVLEACASDGIGFIPWAPLRLPGATGSAAVAEVAARHEASGAQIALAWLLRRSPAMLPIPGTSSPAHLRENLEAARIELSPRDLRELAPR